MIPPSNEPRQTSATPLTARLKHRSSLVETGNEGFTVTELLIALLVIALAIGGLSSIMRLYARQMYRAEALASASRNRAEAEQILETFISTTTEASAADWNCQGHRISGTCAGADGESACSISLEREGRTWRLALDRGQVTTSAGPFLAADPYFRCGWTLTPQGWENDHRATTIVVFLENDVDQTPWISASDK